MSDYQMRAILRRHYPNLDAETYAEIQRLRWIILGADEAASLQMEEAFL
ncbi:hypothetical protein GS397_10435 [Sphingobium yanoikuyae]|uniref:Uncharacterized protein n=1 Tax=Sphingobium yanoikuyae TaxID=13690 RepID=A0A6P1GGA7_SPHYA|nr:hypothetical protein [Sphingobium yanoikuyae]QHD67428.1 hypothetical protein GS397_10435 [Sphingobium yanoikuyae]